MGGWEILNYSIKFYTTINYNIRTSSGNAWHDRNASIRKSKQVQATDIAIKNGCMAGNKQQQTICLFANLTDIAMRFLTASLMQ